MDITELLAQARPSSLDPKTETDRRASDLARAFAAPRTDMPAKPGASRRPGARRAPSPARVIGIGISVAALAGTAGAVVALSATGTPAARPQPAAAHAGTAVTTPGEIKDAVLTAFNGAEGDVMFNKMTEIYPKIPKYNNVSQNWSYPIQPKGGQLARVRSLLVTYDPTEKSDVEWIYTEPRGAKAALPTKTEMIFVQYANRTWSDTTAQVATQSAAASMQELRQSIVTGDFATARKTELNGQTVLELSTHSKDHGGENVETMWINLATNLPVRTYTANGAVKIQVDYEFLPPTPANMAKLNPVIPAGFTRTATIKN
ncbi:MAG TPA: hypothetical protein VK817_01695 [Trebonia sp.]|jgi:hypothetical protein|nr:hypothetical protein [Trebonia sp.]